MFRHTQILKPPAARVAEVVTRSSLASQCQRRDALLDGSRLRKQRIPLQNHVELKGWASLKTGYSKIHWLIHIPSLVGGNWNMAGL